MSNKEKKNYEPNHNQGQKIIFPECDMSKTKQEVNRLQRVVSYTVGEDEIKAMQVAAGVVKLTFMVVAGPGDYWSPNERKFRPAKLTDGRYAFEARFNENDEGFEQWKRFKEECDAILNPK